MQSAKRETETRRKDGTLGQKCDFCGDHVTAVRRVALDHEYDRLQKAHKELYSCASCFEAKEQKRLGLKHR